jgi:hypothetical protein
LKQNGGGHEAQTQRFWDAVSKPENAKGVEKINVDQLNVGQKFYLKAPGVSHAELTVIHVNPDTGDVQVKDGTTFGHQDLPAGAEIYIKKWSLVKGAKPKFAAGDFSFDQPESIADQKARLQRQAKERLAAAKLAEQKAFVARGGDRLTGSDLDTTKEMFGAEVKTDKSGQQSMFAAGDAKKQTETPEFKAWFGDSKVTNEDGTPKLVYSGHSNAEIYGNKYDPKKGTAGGFYATEEPKIASSYALGKMGVREFYENGDQYKFRLKNGAWGKKMNQVELTPEQQQKAREFFASDDRGIELEQRWKENARFDADARRALARGGLRDLQSIWKQLESDGYNIAYADEGSNPLFQRQNKSTFEELLDHLGIE